MPYHCWWAWWGWGLAFCARSEPRRRVHWQNSEASLPFPWGCGFTGFKLCQATQARHGDDAFIACFVVAWGCVLWACCMTYKPQSLPASAPALHRSDPHSQAPTTHKTTAHAHKKPWTVAKAAAAPAAATAAPRVPVPVPASRRR